ncbi:MAG: M1 family metallopeptidase [Acidobacteriota bacterium]
MNLKNVRSLITAAAILLLAALFADAQTSTRPSFNRTSTFDVQHYTIRASFDRTKKEVAGDTTVELRPLADGFREFELDAEDMAFKVVSLEPSGTELKYSTSANSIRITLDRSYSPSETIAVRLKYTATPKKGVYFVDADTGATTVNHSAQVWSQGEADEAHHWFPSFDFPSDKATTEEYLTAFTDETVIGNGEFLGKTDNNNGTSTWHFKMTVPHSTYLVSFVIGKYVRVDDKYGEVPLGFFVYPGKEATARNAFGKTKNMIAVYEKLTGVKFPYNKYDQTIVAKFQFGGMENITATTMADTEIFFGDFEFGKEIVTDLVSHELAHSWFGDLVTCKNWAELWLNEGFATYMEAAYREQINGRSDYLRKVHADATEFLADDAITRRRHGLYNLRGSDIARLFDVSAVTYNKGGVVLHMLREQIGTEAFWKGINAYLNKHKFDNVETQDLEAAMEEASGQDLRWFFDQWVYHSGAPHFTVSSAYSGRTRTLKLSISQTQKADSLVPAAFRVPLDIEVKTDAGTEIFSKTVMKRSETYSIKLKSRPVKLSLSPDEKHPEDKAPAKTVKVTPIVYVR